MDGLRHPVPAPLIDELFRASRGERWGLSRAAFEAAITESVDAICKDRSVPPDEVRDIARRLHVEDLALARACMGGHDEAWQHFMLEHRPALYRCADALDSSGAARELADALYADLYGATRAQGRPLLAYFHGRSSLATWLRTVLAQRHVDAIRARRRTDPLEDGVPVPAGVTAMDPDRAILLPLVDQALRSAIDTLPAKDRLRLRSYHAAGLTLAQIGKLTGEHEATVSRHLARSRKDVRAAADAWLRDHGGLDTARVSRAYELAIEDPGELSLQGIFGEDDRKE